MAAPSVRNENGDEGLPVGAGEMGQGRRTGGNLLVGEDKGSRSRIEPAVEEPGGTSRFRPKESVPVHGKKTDPLGKPIVPRGSDPEEKFAYDWPSSIFRDFGEPQDDAVVVLFLAHDGIDDRLARRRGVGAASVIGAFEIYPAVEADGRDPQDAVDTRDRWSLSFRPPSAGRRRSKGGLFRELDRKVADRSPGSERDVGRDDPSPQMRGPERKTLPKGGPIRGLGKDGRRSHAGRDGRRENPESGRSGIEEQLPDCETAFENISKTDSGRNGGQIDVGRREGFPFHHPPDRDGDAVR